MAIRVALNHVTRYQYDRPVLLSPQVVRLRPAPHTRTPILAYSLKVKPENYFINWQQDPFGNYLARFVFQEKTREFSVEVDLIAEMTAVNPFDFFLEDEYEHYPLNYPPQLAKDLAPYLRLEENGPHLMEWLRGVDCSRQRVVDFLVALNHRLQRDIGYTIRLETGIQDCEETLNKAKGSCRDSAWLLAQILRHLGLAARFVSGYLIQLAPDVKSLDGPSGPETDFTDLHAWTEVFLPGAGWVGLDPTSGLLAGEEHIPLACTPDPISAAPITGAVEKSEVEFYYHNRVQRIHEDPRVTLPYSEIQWSTINALGRLVDARLREGDVRLTMGGEPTFISVDDMDSPEWNTAALGEDKRRLAEELLRRLYTRFASGGVLHYSQGKWYPGEPLPRWALNCYWRQDGKPIWQDQARLADPARDYGHGPREARRFIERLAECLDVSPELVLPSFEDAYYYLWKEGNLPVNLDVMRSDLKDGLERKRLRRLLEGGLDREVGYVLPLKWQYEHAHGEGYWRSSRWEFRRGYMFLLPGDSPMGLRLPLDSLPWVAPEERDAGHEKSLFEPRGPLRDEFGEISRAYSHALPRSPGLDHLHEQVVETRATRKPRGGEVVHTALCVEPREGRLHVFMPPLNELEHYLDLLASVETTAAYLDLPVILEGYPPPADWRLKRLSVTPDPGVIELNVQPAETWDELVDITTHLYQEARQARLGTEKFMLDGRHTGTGGGNHITVGGPTPADSPLLRRPDLLQSLITYWQHHPSLSYLFSGLFIGPSCQSPRVDEARHESLYELEIAFRQMPGGEVSQPWLVDRLLRHLLVDPTGNTHRAEFCMDKLYSPDSANGRMGLLELRAFEMPPHSRMSLVQMLLLRALIARFWERPYHHRLVRWGTELHDRWMLPHFIWQDIRQIIAELREAGYPFQADWLVPFMEFRFPHYGSTRVEDIHLELRLALEPWHVLGEEMSNQGTARFVDSSVERLQVKVTGLTDSRYVLVCNGRRVPLHQTGTHGEYVAGVRYKAWQPPSALHPLINRHSPLVFDLLDTWNGRSVGGCTYHVAHPGGRNYEVFPVNAFEAEARRIARFEPLGHSPEVLEVPPDLRKLAQFFPEGHAIGPMQPPGEERNPEYPHTLDLRTGD